VTLVAKLVSRADPASAAGISSVLLGAVFVLLTAGLARSLWRQSASAALTWILLLWNPIALLWFGYVESYPLVLTLQVSLAWALVQGVRGRFPVWGVALIMAAANASHVLTLAWWPSLFVLMWWRQQRRIQGRPRLGGVLLRSVGLCAAVLAVVVAVWLLLRVDLGEIVQRLGSQRGIDSISGRWFVSRAHLFDVFNEVALLLAPALLLAIGSLVAGARLSMFPRSAEGSTLLGLLLGPLLTLLFVPPLLGGARDWDLYATVALPLILWSVQMWSQVQRPEPVAKRAKPAAKRTKPAARPVAEHGDVVLATRAIGLAAALTLGWVVVPLNADRGARHFEVLQEPRGTFAAFARAHGNEALGVYYRSRDAGREHAAWVRATEADPLNPRYHINRANAALKLRAIAEAQHHFERALDRGLDEWHVYYNLGVCAMQLGEPARAETWYTQLIDKYPEEWRGWGGRGEARLALKRPAEALGDLQQLVQMQPDGAYGFQLLGRAYQDTGQPTEARAAWQRALQLDPADQRTRQLLGLP
jgi:hypothetical protein